MNIELNPLTIIDLLSIFSSLFLGILFISFKTKKNKSNLFLSFFLLSLCLEIVSAFLESNGISSPALLNGVFTLSFLFFYILRSLNYKIRKVHLIYNSLFILPFIEFIPHFVSYILSLILLCYSLALLNKHKKTLGFYYSEIENRSLSWIKNIIYYYLIFNIGWAIEDIVGLEFEDMVSYFAIASSFLTFIMIYWFACNGFLQPEIFDSNIKIHNKVNNEPENIIISDIKSECLAKNKDSKVEIAETYDFDNILKTIESKKLFLQKDITLRKMAQDLSINEKKLSRLINLYTGKNFYHFINNFRVNEFKDLCKTNKIQQMSLLGLANEAGFNSKSTFYSVFKQSEKMTPSQYIKQINKSEE
ncbi:MAG: helix-turn-helix domain-containing protein [Marinifilaceae bacterium]|jgi:AraC-like DNA-binding protein|nr:helix-turn-helix domain-containing protein [Marinifilaceae bacterium]